MNNPSLTTSLLSAVIYRSIIWNFFPSCIRATYRKIDCSERVVSIIGEQRNTCSPSTKRICHLPTLHAHIFDLARSCLRFLAPATPRRWHDRACLPAPLASHKVIYNNVRPFIISESQKIIQACYYHEQQRRCHPLSS